MPLNEAYGFTRSNLTKEQKREAWAVVYGQPVPSMTPQLTRDEIERMRTLVAQHDTQGSVKEFDLNNPPVAPYVFKEFPMTVYKKSAAPKAASGAGYDNKVVADQEALDSALKDGWRNEPPKAEEAEQDTGKEKPANSAPSHAPAAKK